MMVVSERIFVNVLVVTFNRIITSVTAYSVLETITYA